MKMTVKRRGALKTHKGVPRSAKQEGNAKEGLLDLTLRLQREQIRALEDRLAGQEAELRAHRSLQNEGFERHPIPCVELLPNGIIRGASESAAALLGVEKTKILYTALRSFIAPKDLEVFYRHIQQCLTSADERKLIETDIHLQEGTRLRPVRLISVPLLKKRKDQVIPTAIVDMTECWAAKGWRALEDKTFQQLVESVDGIIWEAENTTQLRYVSGQIERMLGYPRERFLTDVSLWQALIHVDDRERVLQDRDNALRGGAHTVTDYRIRTGRGGLMWFRDSMIATRDAQGNSRLRGLAVNITPLKQAEENLHRAHMETAAQSAEHERHFKETVRSMETFCYGIAHELRATVRAIQGFGELLLNQPENPRRQEYVRRMATAASRADVLISDLLAYGRLHHTNLLVVPTAVSTTIARVVEMLAETIREKGAEVRTAPTRERVLAHPPLLVQALHNLVANALKFVPKGRAPCIEIYARAIGRHSVRIHVRDNGVGVQPEFHERIFGLFERLHRDDEYPGTGIGLAMVKRIVELLNGRVGVDFGMTEGSCFWMELPAAQ